MAKDYTAFCEELWRGWLEHGLSAPPLAASPFVRKVFDLCAAPEPYIYFCAEAKPLVALTTNPGATMCHQCRATVKVGDGPLSEKDQYDEAARKLGDFYKRHLTGQALRPARQRIEKLEKLSSWLEFQGVVQVEAFPFHSPSLWQKSALLRELEKDGLLRQYAGHLQEYLMKRPVVILQAVSTRASLTRETPESPEWTDWLTWIAEIAGLDMNAAEFVPLVERGPRTNVAAWVSGEPPKALVLMMGGNGLPADPGLRALANKLRELWGCGSRSV